MKRKYPLRTSRPRRGGQSSAGRIRIVGGTLRGRVVPFQLRPGIRPMKDRVREAIFNRIGPAIQQTHAVDLFAGTGALGIESLSRGAARATFIERHLPTARQLIESLRTFGVENRSEVVQTSALDWARRLGGPFPLPTVVFCSPPYDDYLEQTQEIIELLKIMIDRSPAGSLLVVESDRRFSFDSIDFCGPWDVRSYPPAMVGIGRSAGWRGAKEMN